MKRRNTHFRAMCWLIVLHSLVLSATASSQVLRRGNNRDPESLDPHKSSFAFEQSIQHDLYEGLVTFAPGGAITGGAARRWEISPDGTRYTFWLRRDLHWSNGDPLAANDFVYSFRRLVNPATKSPYAFLAYPIRNATEIAGGKNPDVEQLAVEAPSNDVVRITLSTPTPYFLTALTNSCFSPVNRRAIEQYGNNFAQPGRLIGNGAYVLENWTPKARIVLKKNPHYWDAHRVRIVEVDYLAMPDASDEFQHYLAGDTDITWDVPAGQIANLKASHANEFKIFPYLGVYYYAFELKSPPFKDDPRLRKALALVIDREFITREITGGGELPGYTYVPPGLSAYNSQPVSWKNLSAEQRLAEAKKMYAESGHGPASPLKLQILRANVGVRRQVAEAIARKWKETLGVEAVIAEDNATAAADGSGQITGLGWNADYADANTFLEIWRSDSTDNTSGYRNQEYDSLVRKAAGEKDASERARMLQEAERVLLNDMPMIPLYDFVLKRMVRSTVIGYSPNILGYVYSKDLAIASDKNRTHQ